MKFQIGDVVESYVTGIERTVIEGNQAPSDSNTIGINYVNRHENMYELIKRPEPPKPSEMQVASKMIAELYLGLIEEGIEPSVAFQFTMKMVLGGMNK